MYRFFMAIAVLFLSTSLSAAATYTANVSARIDNAFLRNPSDNAKVVQGGALNLEMTYSFPPSRQFGGDYLYNPGLESLTLTTPQGFSLSLDNRVVSIASIGTTDFFTAQSFLSEDPNGWNLVLDITATGWRDGDISLPATFPSRFASAYISAYFLDEFDVIQSIDATVQSISPAAVPLPTTGALLVSAAGLALWSRRKKAATTQDKT